MKYSPPITITTHQLATVVALRDIAPYIVEQICKACSGVHTSIIEFDDSIYPNSSMCYFNSTVGIIHLLTLDIDIPTLGITIKLEEDDVEMFLKVIGDNCMVGSRPPITAEETSDVEV